MEFVRAKSAKNRKDAKKTRKLHEEIT
jgi:hypothetical protein